MSDLTREIDSFETELVSVDSKQRTKQDQDIFTLARLLLQLSQKVDGLEIE
jgi:hypothetical protein